MPKHQPSIALDEIGIDILRDLQFFGFLTVKQCHRIHADQLSLSAISRRLKNLESSSPPLALSFGNSIAGFQRIPKVYYISEKGYELLQDEAFPTHEVGEFKKRSKPIWSPIFKHRTMLIDALISLRIALLRAPWLKMSKVYLDYNLDAHGHRETMDFVSDHRISEDKIIPDATVVIYSEKTQNHALLLLELDRGTEVIRSDIRHHDGLTTITERLKKYDRYFQSGNYQRKYDQFPNINSAMLLFITGSDRRINNIKEKCQSFMSNWSSSCLFNTFERTQKDFFDPSWATRDLNDNEKYSIIDLKDVEEPTSHVQPS